ncbi:hypothetical protein [Candidatus Thiodictyon syntrophicum]|jgi:hypothetical protein|nr:hypothetical protein [Candidatus Thiodictyon syntrophicum]
MRIKREIKDPEEMREEYDFENMKGGVRGKYAKAFEGTVTTILLDADVAEVFPDARAVNEALRTLSRILRSGQINA